MSLIVVPVSLDTANAFVARHHRHNKPVRGHKFSLGVQDEAGQLRGVAIVGRPIARLLDDGFTVEVLRCCTNGARNACSMLYGAAWRAARAMGYCRAVTYTLESEHGTSLRASGWREVADVRGGSWSREDRPRVDQAPLMGDKTRWEVRVA